MRAKCMHFNSSCSYTALAMMLSEKGIDTEDTEIALEIGLPWMFEKKEGYFLAGAMLHGAQRWPLKGAISIGDLKELVERYIALCEKNCSSINHIE